MLSIVTLQRLVELWLSNVNTGRLLARGAHEVGRAHYPLIVAVHVAWLASLWWLAPGRPIDGFWLGDFRAAQLGRIWVIATSAPAGRRGLSCSRAPLVRTGPYRFVSHPNYLVVVGEIAILPLVFGLWPVALIFSLLNAAVLAVRIREENRALRR